jgi:hypothetical protein
LVRTTIDLRRDYNSTDKAESNNDVFGRLHEGRIEGGVAWRRDPTCCRIVG